MSLYIALLRGINVGGKNQIRMTDLAACFTDLGFTDVRTYIQSGNVIFRTDQTDPAQLAARIEEGLSNTFHYQASLVLRSYDQMREVVSEPPAGFGDEPDVYRYDVVFLKAPLTAAEALQQVSPKEGVDQADAGDGVLYFSRLIRKASQSHLTRIIGSPIYQSLTIRNWNTTTKLLAIMGTMEP